MMNELLEFEKNSQVLNFRYNFNNELIWPFFRTLIYQNIIYEKYGNKIEIVRKSNKENKFYNHIVKNPYLCKEKKILFFYGNTSNILDKDGVYFNRLFDYYSCIYEKDTLMIEEKNIQAHEMPRRFSNVKYQDFIEKIVEIKSDMIGDKYHKADISSTDQFLSYLQGNLPMKLEKGFYEGLRINVLKLSVKIIYYNYYYKTLINNIKPEIIFFEDACYGSKAYAIKLANELGIKTAEFQHGYVGLQHPAYNYPLNIYQNEEYKRYMPQYYLTFGQYWNENIRLPIKTQVIGNPHLYAKVNKYKKDNCIKISNLNNNKIILLISSGNCYKDYINLIESISPKLNGKYQIIVRLHPLERNSKQNYDCLKKINIVNINDEGDIYDYINKSEYIIGDSSTSLYEAVALNKKVLILENSDSILYTSKNFGTWFKNADELYHYLTNDNEIKEINDAGYFWEENWERNYREFIKEEVGLFL